VGCDKVYNTLLILYKGDGREKKTNFSSTYSHIPEQSRVFNSGGVRKTHGCKKECAFSDTDTFASKGLNLS